MNKEGIELLKSFEGWSPVAYIPVPGDVPTIGYGFTHGVKMGDKMSRQQGEARLKKEVAKYADGVLKVCMVTPNDNQHAALTCFAFNVGLAGFAKSTVLKAHNRGDEQSASRAFGLWNKSGGVVYAGLTRRRAAEAALYLKPIPEEQADHPMPQSIEEERSLARSPIANAAGGMSLTSGAAGISQLASMSSEVGTIREGFGAYMPYLILGLCVVGLVVGGFIVWQRWRQKRAGWA